MSARKGPPQLATVLHNYKASHADELSLKKNDTVFIITEYIQWYALHYILVHGSIRVPFIIILYVYCIMCDIYIVYIFHILYLYYDTVFIFYALYTHTSFNPQNLRNIIKKVAKISITQIIIELVCQNNRILLFF